MVGLKKCSFIHISTVAVLVMCVSEIIASATETVKLNFYTYGGENVNATLVDNHLAVKCGPRTGSAVPFKNILNIQVVRIYNCPPPREAYAVELSNLNVNTSAIQELFLHQITGDMLLRAKHFKELKIKKLHIKNCNKNLVIPASDALELLTALTDLHLEEAGLPLLSKASNVKYITVENGRVRSEKLSGCNELRELTLIDTYPRNVPSHWLENCTKLEILRVNWLQKNLLPHSLNNVLEGATNLHKLDLTACNLSTLPWEWFTQAKQLRRLVLSKIYLKDTVFRDFKMNNVSYVDLKDCHINSLKGLPVSNASQLEVDLRNNILADVELESEDYEMLKKNNMTVNVTLTKPIYLNCYDCKHGSLWRAVREKRLIIDVRCNEGVKLGDADLKAIDHAECKMYKCEEKKSQCQCKRALNSSARWANCENLQLKNLPREPRLRKLYAAGNKISNIYADDLLDSLQYLDLTNNSISMVNAAVVGKLFSVPERRVRLSGNPIACICDNKPLLDALRVNENRVEDYNNILCGSGDHVGEPISELDPAKLCPTQQSSSGSVHLGITLGVLTMICLSLLVLYYRYKLAIKVFLYTRGWCLCCVRDEELDAGRRYDAFTSFSHKDASIVVKELVPKLESPPFSYKLCVYYRDWLAGDCIEKQIKTSVAQSRRTIIVLSRNFMKSKWGLIEFREANINTMREGRVRVIVIVIDDVLEDEKLDSEWRAYLKANIYVKWGDPWFWDKLKYAMPHRTTERIV